MARGLVPTLVACVFALARGQETEVHELGLVTIAEKYAGSTDAQDRLFTLTLTDGEMDAATAPTLARQLQGLPGVVAQESFGGFDPPRLTLRGSGLQSAPVSRGVLWMLDDMPLNAADGSFNSALIDPDLFDAATVRLGAADPMAATQAAGGVLRLESADAGSRGSDRAWLSLGEHRHARTGAIGSWSSKDKARMHGGVSCASWEGWREHSRQSRVAAQARYVRSLGKSGPDLRLGLYFAGAALDVPGPLTLEAARETPDHVAPIVAADKPRRESDLLRLDAGLAWSHDAGNATRLDLAYARSNDWFRQLRANGGSETDGGDVAGLIETTRSLGRHALRAGALVRSGERSQRRWANTLARVGPRFADLDLEADHASAWCDDTWRLGAGLALEGGASFSHTSRAARGWPASGRGSFDDDAFAPRLGLTWDANPHLRVSGRAMRGFEPPSLDDLVATVGPPRALSVAWTPLRTQQSDTLELSFSGNSGPLAWSCTGYASRWTDELLRLAGPDGVPRGTANAGATRHEGLESALRWRVLQGRPGSLDLAIAHTWSRARFGRDAAYQGRDLAGLPPHAGSAQLSWSTEHGIFATLGVSWIAGTTWADHANRLGYPGYTIGTLRVGWRFNDGVSACIDVDNLLDRGFIASTSGVVDVARDPAATLLFLPGTPRQFRVTVCWRR